MLFELGICLFCSPHKASVDCVERNGGFIKTVWNFTNTHGNRFFRAASFAWGGKRAAVLELRIRDKKVMPEVNYSIKNMSQIHVSLMNNLWNSQRKPLLGNTVTISQIFVMAYVKILQIFDQNKGYFGSFP